MTSVKSWLHSLPCSVQLHEWEFNSVENHIFNSVQKPLYQLSPEFASVISGLSVDVFHYAIFRPDEGVSFPHSYTFYTHHLLVVYCSLLAVKLTLLYCVQWYQHWCIGIVHVFFFTHSIIDVVGWARLLLWICLFSANQGQDHSTWIFSEGIDICALFYNRVRTDLVTDSGPHPVQCISTRCQSLLYIGTGTTVQVISVSSMSPLMLIHCCQYGWSLYELKLMST